MAPHVGRRPRRQAQPDRRSLIEANAAELAELEARDGGGTIRKAMLADVPGAQNAFEWFAQCAETVPDVVELEGSPFPDSRNYLRFEPIGVTTGIIPWNFPLIMAAWKIAPVHRRGQLLGDQAGLVHLAHRPAAG